LAIVSAVIVILGIVGLILIIMKDSLFVSSDDEKSKKDSTFQIVTTPAQTTTPTPMPGTELPTAGEPMKNFLGMEFVWIPAGRFMMGSDQKFNLSGESESESGDAPPSYENPRRRITIREGFWMSKHEVTQDAWELLEKRNPSLFADCDSGCPVDSVSWSEAQQFIIKMNEKNDGLVYSLPSEAQWEYAARAESATEYAFGRSLSTSQANFDGRFRRGVRIGGTAYEKSRKVGSYKPNKWGLYDMHGNVAEWVEDYFSDTYQGLPTDGSANTQSGYYGQRVVRGGSWNDDVWYLRSSARRPVGPSEKLSTVGFRLVARLK